MGALRKGRRWRALTARVAGGAAKIPEQVPVQPLSAHPRRWREKVATSTAGICGHGEASAWGEAGPNATPIESTATRAGSSFRRSPISEPHRRGGMGVCVALGEVGHSLLLGGLVQPAPKQQHPEPEHVHKWVDASARKTSLLARGGVCVVCAWCVRVRVCEGERDRGRPRWRRVVCACACV